MRSPQSVAITKGGDGAYVWFNADAGVTSFLCAFVEGTNVEATFQWTNATHVLVVEWRPTDPQPNVKGVFRCGEGGS